MNTLELQHILSRDPITQPYMGRVCALDQLPRKITHRPTFYIINSQPSHKPGKHWLVLYFPRIGSVEFFDSLGHGPNYYSWRLERYLKTQGGYCIYNKRRYQQVGTKTCGQFCCYYVHQRCMDRPMRDILKDFDEQRLNYNEEMVTEFMTDQYLVEDMDHLNLD